eukprot:m.71135 g.71135  ORF g.71135 m.71135 type:complete len:55 (-) comp50163_c0_seq1:1091-1255(-)
MFRFLSNPKQVGVISTFLLGSAAVNAFIGYQMWGERGVANRKWISENILNLPSK